LSLISLLLLFSVGIITLIVASNVYYRKLLDFFVHTKLNDITSIFETGEPPSHWHDVSGIRSNDIKHLDKLIRYLMRTRLVVDEQTRKEVYEKLSEIRLNWCCRLTNQQ
jgi:hypothetical protein